MSSFLNHSKPLIVSMVQATTPDGVKELMDLSLSEGADAFGMQFCKLEKEHHNESTYKTLFEYAKGKPTYVTNYRLSTNKDKTDDMLGEELIGIAECGATLCDVMSDFYDRQPGEFTTDPTAIKKQKELIKLIHARGSEVLMSTHIQKFTPAERILEIALAQQERGADICKIVAGASTMSEQIENFRIIDLLREKLSIPFLFLSGGKSRLIRRIGGELGCCMYLCVAKHDALATPIQPLIKDVKLIRSLVCEE